MADKVSGTRMDTQVLLSRAQAVLSQMQVTATSATRMIDPLTSRNIPPETTKAYKHLRTTAINAFRSILQQARGRQLIEAWLKANGVLEEYMISALLHPEDPEQSAGAHRGNWAGYIHMAQQWSKHFPILQETARLYDAFKAAHPGLILVGGSFTPIMERVVKGDMQALARTGEKFVTFLISSPGGRVSVLSALDDEYRRLAFTGRTCWCIDAAGSCGAFFLVLGDHVDVWSETGTKANDAVVMFHQVRGMMNGMLSLHALERIAGDFRTVQDSVDARCILPNFEFGFKRAGHGSKEDGFRLWVDRMAPALLLWPIFKAQGRDPLYPMRRWTKSRLKQHFESFSPYASSPRKGGIMEALFSALGEYDFLAMDKAQMRDFFPYRMK